MQIRNNVIVNCLYCTVIHNRLLFLMDNQLHSHHYYNASFSSSRPKVTVFIIYMIPFTSND